ncbi:MAG: diadenylate cyclase CdaA [Eubacterium sp.]|nr:diadenylate cyclase CdaA [Eubacterium sp.]
MEELILYIQSKITINSVIEIAIIAFLIYKVLKWMRGTQAEQVVRGIAILLVLAPLSSWLKFTTLNYIITMLFTWAFIIFVVVFQPELRSALEQLGNNRFFRRIYWRADKNSVARDVKEITKAVESLSKQHIGALIVCERDTGLKNIMDTGIQLDSDISRELLENIFTPNRPLHDGAVVMKLWSNRLCAAGCLLPLSDNRYLGSELGTRHRAGLGISEKSDAFTIIVSEETGTISYTEKGILNRGMTAGDIEELLLDRFTQEESDDDKGFLKLWGKKDGKKQENTHE